MTEILPSDLLFTDDDASNFLPYAEARAFARSLKLKSFKEWTEYCKSRKKPIEIPADPSGFYPEEFISVSDWLGTKRLIHGFIPYKEALKFALSLGLKSQKEWDLFAKSDSRPINIPARPSLVYRNSGWESWADWLGTENFIYIDWLPFKDARNFVRELKFTSKREWHSWRKTKKRPKNIPSTPNEVYKDEWISWPDWFGTMNSYSERQKIFRNPMDKRQKLWMPFKNARIFVRKFGLKSRASWIVFSQSPKCPFNIPSWPKMVYKEWISWDDWLGRSGWRSFNDAREFVRTLNLSSKLDWQNFSKVNRPVDIPSNPNVVYKDGWKGMKDWLRK